MDEPSPFQDPGALAAAEMEVYWQSGHVLLAADELERVLAERKDRPSGIEWTAPVFAKLQALLTAAANVSKLLWGMNETETAERKPLRALIGVPDDREDSPLGDRALRDYFDHFDRELVKWAQLPEGQIMSYSLPTLRHLDLGFSIDGGPMITPTGAETLVRNFDPETWAATFADETFHIRPMVEAARKLREHEPFYVRLVSSIPPG